MVSKFISYQYPGRIFLLILFSVLINLSKAQDAKDIIRKVDEKLRSGTSYSEISIQIIRKTWSREISMKSWTEGRENALILITSPAKEKGVAFLKRGKEVWNWVPSIERTIKLPPSMMMQSWMGTDFTNDDLVKESSIVEDYFHKITGDSIISSRKCWKIELTPKPDAAVVWGKIITWIDKQDYIELLTLFYDEDSMLINILTASEIKNLGGKILPSRIELIPHNKEGQKTIMEYRTLTFNNKIENNFFIPDNLRKVR